jgi:hypothetical protein
LRRRVEAFEGHVEAVEASRPSYMLTEHGVTVASIKATSRQHRGIEAVLEAAVELVEARAQHMTPRA